jgi:hypothetical protein
VQSLFQRDGHIIVVEKAFRGIRQTARTLQFLSLICFLVSVSSVLKFSISDASADKDYLNGFPNDPSFFPIGVWMQSPGRAPQYRAIGINTFVGLWEGPTQEQLATLQKFNMFVVAAQNDLALHSPSRQIIRGWLHVDEPDNAQPVGFGFYGSCIPAPEIVRRTQEMKANDNTRPVIIGFGQGVANEYWKGRGACNDDKAYYSEAAAGVDILSFDIYPVGSSTPQVKGKLEYVARGVSELRKIAVDDQKVWSTIETTALDPSHPVTAAQLRAEVWMAIISGARGIVYFVHEFSPIFREDAIFRHPDVVSEVTKQNGLIRSLATVLNSPDVGGAIDVQSTIPVVTLVKRYNNSLYVFTVALANAPSQPQFTIHRYNGRKVTVVGENRNLTITAGGFQDRFEGYGVHIYEISLSTQRSE